MLLLSTKVSLPVLLLLTKVSLCCYCQQSISTSVVIVQRYLYQCCYCTKVSLPVLLLSTKVSLPGISSVVISTKVSLPVLLLSTKVSLPVFLLLTKVSRIVDYRKSVLVIK